MENKSIAHIKQLFENDSLTELEILALRNDGRKGIQQLLRTYDRRQKENQLASQLFEQMKQFDEQYKRENDLLIAGIDEAGRGPLAGPVVSAAVILPSDFTLIGLTDSKLLSEQQRNDFYHYITEHALDYTIAIIDNEMIDRINILEATKQSMQEAIVQLDPTPAVTLIDAVDIRVKETQTVSIIKGDQKSLSIAAASILAKVARDRLMIEIDAQYPMYGFKNNKGYGSAQHLQALKKYGPSPYHRTSFSPVQNVLDRTNG